MKFPCSVRRSIGSSSGYELKESRSTETRGMVTSSRRGLASHSCSGHGVDSQADPYCHHRRAHRYGRTGPHLHSSLTRASKTSSKIIYGPWDWTSTMVLPRRWWRTPKWPNGEPVCNNGWPSSSSGLTVPQSGATKQENDTIVYTSNTRSAPMSCTANWGSPRRP